MTDSVKTTVDAFIEQYFDKNEVQVIQQDVNTCGSRT